MTYFLVVVLCLILSGFFSSSETALLRIRPEELDRESAESKKLSATAAKSLIESPSKLLVTILLGNNVVNILGASCASMLAVQLFGEKIGVALATILMTVFVLVFSEIVPKAIASRDPIRVAEIVSLPLYLVHQASRPMHYFFSSFIDPWITRLVGSEKNSSDVNAYDSLLRLASQIRAKRSELGPVSIIQSTVKAQKLLVQDVMVPKSEIFAVSEKEDVKDALAQMLDNRFTRIPIYQETLDTMVGLIHFKDLVAASQRPGSTLKQIVRPVLRVPGKKPILSLLSDMQTSSIQMAIVKDEFGHTHGLITQEDILEELVGEIRDEFDSEELSAIHKLSDQSYRVMGRVSVRDFNRASGWNILAAESETVGGLVLNQLGKIPHIGSQVSQEDYELKVIEMAGNRIVQVKIDRTTNEPAKEGE